MQNQNKSVVLVSMPFAGVLIPSIQLSVLESYLKAKHISVESKHLYLKAAEFFGLQNYNALINPPNDSYASQMAFSKILFPDHWNQKTQRNKEYYTEKILKDSLLELSFEDYVCKTDEFYHFVVDNICWEQYDLIGFTLNYGQFFPSLVVAKKIKERFPEKKIVFGGSRTVGDMGVHTLRYFDFVDYIVSGDGEESLFLLASNTDVSGIPNLIFRDESGSICTNPSQTVDLSSLQIPRYDSFYDELALVDKDIQQFFSYFGRIPVEISRGCWWNKCTFCNLNIQHCGYREKNFDDIVREICVLSERYRMLDFQLIGNTLPRDYKTFLTRLSGLDGDFRFFVEARAGRLKSSDYRLLKEAGCMTIQTGIESFSEHYLKTMKKGVRVIDNIAALKFCKENNIINRYNLIVQYPNEQWIDYEQTRQTIGRVESYLDPPQLCNLRVLFGSDLYQFPERFNIASLEYADIDTIMFPKALLEKGFAFVYEFIRDNEQESLNWGELVSHWNAVYEHHASEWLASQSMLDRLVFYFVDGGSFVKIYDKRNAEQVAMYTLNAREREVLLACADVISYDELRKVLSHIADYELAAILHSFEDNDLVFREDQHYLCLPLNYHLVMGGRSHQQPQRSQCSLEVSSLEV